MRDYMEYKQFLDHLKLIFKIKEECRELGKSELFTTNDVRNTFYSQIMNVINDYYFGMLSPFFITRLDKPFRDGVLRPYFTNLDENDLFSNLGFLCEEGYLKTWIELKKVSLVYNLWIVFEDSIDLIYNSVISDQDKELNLNSNFNRIEKIIHGKLSEAEIHEVKTKLKSTYISINNKYNFILNALELEKNQIKQLSEIREFLQFFNIMRNTLHNNSRPMKNYKFSLKMGEFKFERDKHIDFFTIDVILESIEKFVSIFNLIRENLNFNEEIFNPVSNINKSVS
jgi:REP element-mobilizing transposase RayT